MMRLKPRKPHKPAPSIPPQSLHMSLRGCAQCGAWLCEGGGCNASAAAVCIIVLFFDAKTPAGGLEREYVEGAASCEACAVSLEQTIDRETCGCGSERLPLPPVPARAWPSVAANHRTPFNHHRTDPS